MQYLSSLKVSYYRVARPPREVVKLASYVSPGASHVIIVKREMQCFIICYPSLHIIVGIDTTMNNIFASALAQL